MQIGAATKTFVGCMLDSVKCFLVDVKIAIVLNVILRLFQILIVRTQNGM